MHFTEEVRKSYANYIDHMDIESVYSDDIALMDTRRYDLEHNSMAETMISDRGQAEIFKGID